MLLRLNCDLPTEFFDSLTLIVGQDEDPLALVRCADFTRREYSPRRLVTNLFQLSNDLSESEGDVSFDIFKEAELGSQNPNSVCDEGPEVAGVFCAEPFAGGREGLAWITCHKDVHAISKSFAWEGFNIRPDRCCVQESRLHFCNQVRAGEGFDLTISDNAQIWDCSFKSKMNASVSSAPLDHCNVFGIIHIAFLSFVGGGATTPPLPTQRTESPA
jgi:hypothetical protein